MGSQYSPRIITDGLVLCLDAANNKSYPGSGTVWTDLSNSGNNGTLVNGPTFSSANGGGIVFDNVDDYVNCGNNSSVNFINNFTLGIWFNAQSYGENGFGRLFDKSSGTSNGFALLVDNINQPNGLQFNINNNIGVLFSPANSISLNRYFYVTLVVRSNQAFMYRNGDLINSSATFSSPINTSSVNLLIGNRLATDRTFNGVIGVVQAYSKALTPEEILQNYNATKGRFGL